MPVRHADPWHHDPYDVDPYGRPYAEPYGAAPRRAQPDRVAVAPKVELGRARTGRRGLTLLLGVLLATLAVIGLTTPAGAVPAAAVAAAPSPTAGPDTDDEGGGESLRDRLEAIATGYYDARAKLDESQKVQKRLAGQLLEAKLSLARLQAQVGDIAATRYESAQVDPLANLLTGEFDRATLLDGAALAQYLLWRDDDALSEFQTVKEAVEEQQAELDAQLAIEQKALSDLDKQKRAAENELADYGEMVDFSYQGDIPAAQPAPRNKDGSWPKESCSIDDPTRSGSDACITPRMYHTLNEARLAGFRRTTGCWRWQSWGEHPKGRACDFMATSGAAATGADKEYGNRLSAWMIKNASALGIMYVIWYGRIWMPNTGWRAYSGCCDPSSRHTNHVHVSML